MSFRYHFFLRSAILRKKLKIWSKEIWDFKKWLLLTLTILALVLKLFIFFWFLPLTPIEPSILCSFGEGRLGNQISSYATIFSFHKKFGFRPYVTQEQANLLHFYFEAEKLPLSVITLDLSQFYFSIFGRPVSRLIWEKPWEKIDKVNNNFRYSEINNPSLQKGKALDIGDFPNEVKILKEMLPEIKHKFVLRQGFQDGAQKKLQTVIKKRNLDGKQVTWVGVHNRRGDYGHHLDKLYGLSLLSANYFHKAMNYFSSRYDMVIFVVVTDDMVWAEENLNLPGVEFLGHETVLQKDTDHPLATGEDVGEDLALLAACNHTIMSYGTFGQWAALLAGGEVVISDTAARTKEGRQLQEGGFGPGDENGWVWIEGSEVKQDKFLLNGTPAKSSRLFLFLFVILFDCYSCRV